MYTCYLCWEINPLTANVRIYPHQAHGHQKEALHRSFWTDFYNQGIVGMVFFCSNEDVFIFEIGSETTTWRVFEVRTRPVALDWLQSPQPQRWVQASAVAMATRSVFDEVQKAAANRFEKEHELRSCSTAEEQLVSALKTPRHDFASVLSCTCGIWDAFSLLFSRSAAQWKDLSNGGFIITIG